mgnify:CR=1 FL=1
MKEGAEIYSEFTLSRIKHALKSDPLSERQVRLIRVALAEQASSDKHPIDLRWSLPLGLARLYFCFFAGVDRRSSTIKLQRMRWSVVFKGVRGSVVLALMSIISVAVSIAIFMGLYSVKRALGIDIFPNFHLHDLLPWFS